MSAKIFYAASLFVIVASLLGFITMYNDMDPVYLLVTAVLATFSISLYLIILLTSKNKKSAYQYTFALLGLIFSVIMIDYANNGTPTHIGDLSLYTLKVINALFLFFFAILAFIVFGQLSLEKSQTQREDLAVSQANRSPEPVSDNANTEVRQRGGWSTNRHLTGLSELHKANPSEPVSFSHAFEHGLCRSVTTSLFDVNECFV